MNIEDIREYCLSLPGAEEDMPFGPTVLVFKVGGKLFLLLSLETQVLQFNVKCEPAEAIELREKYPCIVPGYHMNKKHWNTIFVDGSIADDMLRELIYKSFDLVVAKKKAR